MADYAVKIAELEKQLLSLGYQRFQLEQIKKDVPQIEDEDERSQAIIETLEWYIQFANRCNIRAAKSAKER